jgi:hypothetical protein
MINENRLKNEFKKALSLGSWDLQIWNLRIKVFADPPPQYPNQQTTG